MCEVRKDGGRGDGEGEVLPSDGGREDETDSRRAGGGVR